MWGLVTARSLVCPDFPVPTDPPRTYPTIKSLDATEEMLRFLRFWASDGKLTPGSSGLCRRRRDAINRQFVHEELAASVVGSVEIRHVDRLPSLIVTRGRRQDSTCKRQQSVVRSGIRSVRHQDKVIAGSLEYQTIEDLVGQVLLVSGNDPRHRKVQSQISGNVACPKQ